MNHIKVCESANENECDEDRQTDRSTPLYVFTGTRQGKTIGCDAA